MRRARGFTLIEVLIALVVVALALLALTQTASSQVRAFDGLRERALAGWVAANVLSETRLATPMPPIGRSDGRVRFADRDWRWTLDVAATEDAAIRRMDVAVRLGDAEAASASLTGFASAQPSP